MAETKEVKVLITGASGLLGRTVLEYFQDENLQKQYPSSNKSSADETIQLKLNSLGLCFSRARKNLRPLNLEDFDQVEKLVDEFKPDVIVHSAAEKRVENVEKNFDKALQLNVASTEYLANLCAKKNILFIYISTDYVFDGTSPPYKIDAQTNPLNKYGLTKRKGEEVTLASSKKHCIVRVPILYGRTEPNRYDESAINMLIGPVRKMEDFKADNVQARFPTHCLDVARFLLQIIRKYYQAETNKDKTVENPIRGILHCTSLKMYTKYDVCMLMADLYGLSKEHIKEDRSAAEQDPSKPQLRPMNAQLESTYSFDLLDYTPVIELQTSLKDCLENFVKVD